MEQSVSYEHQLVRVLNKGKKPFSGRYGNKPFVIAPNSEGIIPREAAMIHFGDPKACPRCSVAEGICLQHKVAPAAERPVFRDKEYRRLRGRYGALPGSESDEANWTANRPRVEVYELDGTVWNLVIDDPEGAEMPVEETPSLDAQLAAMKAMQERLEQQIAQMQAGVTSVPAPVDSPEQAPKPRGRQAKVAQAVELEEAR